VTKHPEEVGGNLCLITSAKVMGEKYKQAHSPACIIQWCKIEKAKKEEEDCKMVLVQREDGREVEEMTAYSCCKNMWAPGFSALAFKKSKFYWTTQVLLKFKEEGVDRACKQNFERALSDKRFALVHTHGNVMLNFTELGFGPKEGEIFDTLVVQFF
jgi:hypothetical protein